MLPAEVQAGASQRAVYGNIGWRKELVMKRFFFEHFFYNVSDH
jgi:hypothetical protein